MVVRVTAKHSLTPSELLGRAQQRLGFDSVKQSRPNEFELVTSDGRFRIRNGELIMEFNSDGFVTQIPTITNSLGLDLDKVECEISGMIELPFIVRVKFREANNKIDTFINGEEAVFWKLNGKRVINALVKGVTRSRAIKDRIKENLALNIIELEGVVLHCVRTGEVVDASIDELPDLVAGDSDFLENGVNFKAVIGGVSLDLICNLDYESIEDLTSTGRDELIMLGGVPLWMVVSYKVRASGGEIKNMNKMIKAVFNGLEESFSKACDDFGFVVADVTKRKKLREAGITPGEENRVRDTEFLKDVLEQAMDWAKVRKG